MKFEQAMRAMRRGEKVRRKSWPKGNFLSYSNNTFVTLQGAHHAIEAGAEAFNDPHWVVLRKKKKKKLALALRNPFRNPYVGDTFKQAIGTMSFEVVVVTPKCVITKRNDLMCRVHTWPRWIELRKDWRITRRAPKTA